jgi:hypothetical protein
MKEQVKLILEKIPETGEQLLDLGVMYGIVGIGVGLAFLLVGIFVGLKGQTEYEEGLVWLGVVLGIFGVFVGICNGMTIYKVTMAPNVYILEQLAKLIN